MAIDPKQQISNVSDVLGQLVTKLTGQDMPVFSATAKHISDLSSNDDTRMSDLTLGVLRDPALTTKLLTFANSAHFSRGNKISTVSRAVMQLGFKSVRSICLSTCLLEGLLKGQRKDRVLAEVAQSLHPATQARKVAKLLKEPNYEEVFIGGLLHRIGHIAFWCFGGELAEKLERAIAEHPEIPHEKLEQQVLGSA